MCNINILVVGIETVNPPSVTIVDWVNIFPRRTLGEDVNLGYFPVWKTYYFRLDMLVLEEYIIILLIQESTDISVVGTYIQRLGQSVPWFPYDNDRPKVTTSSIPLRSNLFHGEWKSTWSCFSHENGFMSLPFVNAGLCYVYVQLHV